MSVRVVAPAKINLTLRVGKPRADGMHPLQSVVTFADVGDVVEAEANDALSLTIRGPFAAALQADADNLVLRAARALATAAGAPAAGARLVLEKNLPVASGIGGGSSDAAATLRALSALWGLKWSDARLAEIAQGLGSDVPVFFTPGAAAYMTGLGETCAPMTAPSFAGVLVNPMQAVATPSVYRQFDALNLGSVLSDSPPPRWADRADALHHISVIGNDLEPAAAAVAPVIADVLAMLRADELALYAGLSGSGATCFALSESPDAARALGAKLSALQPTWWVCTTQLGRA